jgi:preprotein translocase subunit SecD
MNRPAVLVALALLLSGACDGDGEGDEKAGPGEAAAVFALRPVIDESAPPCPKEAAEKDVDVVAERRDGKVSACLSLGPAIVDASDVRTASLGDLEGGGKSVGIALGRTGAANLDAFAARSQGKRLAIMVKGELVRAPAVRSPTFAGRIEIPGLPDDEATALFEELRARQNQS